MHKKLVQHALLLLVVFGGLYMALSRLDYLRIFHIEGKSVQAEEKIGDLLWKTIKNTETVNRNDSINKMLRRIADQLAAANGFDGKTLKLHLIEKNEVNAFAMPDRHLVLYSGLIESCDSESELAGVMAHELAHIEKGHVMKKMIKEIGFSVVLSMTTGSNSPELVRQGVKLLSSSAYDRKLESEADLAGVDYMIQAGFNPEELADFLYKMGTDADGPDALYWVSTHPESKARAKAVIGYLKTKKYHPKPFLSATDWKYLKTLGKTASKR